MAFSQEKRTQPLVLRSANKRPYPEKRRQRKTNGQLLRQPSAAYHLHASIQCLPILVGSYLF
jgi:hypothetical protein